MTMYTIWIQAKNSRQSFTAGTINTIYFYSRNNQRQSTWCERHTYTRKVSVDCNTNCRAITDKQPTPDDKINKALCGNRQFSYFISSEMIRMYPISHLLLMW